MKEILIISKNTDIIKSFTSMLSPAYRVYGVMSEEKGIEALKKDYSNIAAVLIELTLARGSGFAFIDQLRKYSVLSPIPVIAIIDGLNGEADMDCIEHGFFDLITTATPKLLVRQRVSNAIRVRSSLPLTEVEKMLRVLPSCIFMKDAEGRYVFSTQYWRHLDTDNDPNWTIRGKTDLDIRKDKENARKAMEADQHILETGEGTEYVIEENQDGVREYLQLIKRPVYDDCGSIKGIIALINNVTEYQLLKQELEKRVKTDDYMITAMAADYRSIYYADLDKNECLCVRASSKKDERMWEGRVFPFYEEFVDYAEHYVVDADREAFLDFIKPENIRAELADEAMISHRYLSTKSGTEKYEMLRIAGVRLIEERYDHIVHAIAAGFSDVDRETRDHMEQNRALAEALARAEEANAAKTAFLSSMSHEIRTPMNAIIGLDKIALCDPSISSETRDELEKIGSSARHLLSLINDILDMSRIESGRMELRKEEFSFRELLDQICIIINGQCEDKGLNFVCDIIEPLDEYFLGDDLRLKQIVINILGNAVKFTDAPGMVTFTVEQSDLSGDSRSMRFTIKDTGIGMDATFIPKLFEPFCQEDDTTTNRYGGSGLGMAITKNMIDLMGGMIEVESEKGRGTTFTVCIPLQKAHHIEAAEPVQEEEADISLEGLHVLIAEDMELNAEVLTDLLEMEDITSEWAENGQRAVELFERSEEGHFSAILMDMRMPVMDGLAATRRIRQLERPDAALIPIIALTANAFEEDVKSCLEAGMDAHMSKPVDMEQLKKLLSRMLAKRPADRYIDLHLHLDGAVRIDVARKLARLQDIPLPEDDAELERLLTVPPDCGSLNDFLQCFALPQSLMQTEEGLTEAVRLVADSARDRGVIYAEIRFAPQNHTKQGMSQEEAVKAALKGISETELKVNLILCFMRGEGNEAANEETLELAKEYLVKDGGVVALDLAGAEALYPTEKYRDLFRRAREAGIPFTIHAGEAAGAESVRAAIEFGARRIGHGVRSHEDPEVIALLKEKEIILEMCPTSNRQTHAVEDMSEYPFMDYLRQGLLVTINTDDEGIEGTTLANEFRFMEKTFGLDPQQEKVVLENAVKGAFTDEETKEWLRKELELASQRA